MRVSFYSGLAIVMIAADTANGTSTYEVANFEEEV